MDNIFMTFTKNEEKENHNYYALRVTPVLGIRRHADVWLGFKQLERRCTFGPFPGTESLQSVLSTCIVQKHINVAETGSLKMYMCRAPFAYPWRKQGEREAPNESRSATYSYTECSMNALCSHLHI